MKGELALLLKALTFAARKHRDQRRKDARASPHIKHPIPLCAALLHDTIEDTETTPGELEREFGRDIADIVAELTDNKMLRKRTRKRMQIAQAAGASRQAKLVKLADKICNLRDITARPPANWGVERRREYFDWAKTVVDRLRGTDPKLEAAFDRAYALRPE